MMLTPEQEEWSRHFLPVNRVKGKPPSWIIPELLVPGLNLMIGDPKTFKSFLVMNMIASLLELRFIGKKKITATKRGSVVYFAAEQKPRSIKHIYEQRVLKHSMSNHGINWDFIIPKSVFRWQLDEHEDEYDMASFLKVWKPTLCVIDPLDKFHSMDENDPRIIRPLIPIKEAVDSYSGAIIVVHHTNKRASNPTNPWSNSRGSTALWAMADAGIKLSRLPSGTIKIETDFKEHEGGTWTWRPNK